MTRVGRRALALLALALLLPHAPLVASGQAAGATLVLAYDMPAEPGTVPEGLTDASGAGNHGLPANMLVSDGSGAVGRGTLHDPYALRFDGVDDVVSTTRELDAPDNLTLSVWFRTDRAGGKLVGFESQRAGRSGYYDRHVYLGMDGAPRFSIAATNGTFTGPTGLADGRWHHVFVAWSRDGTVGHGALYVDGELVDAHETGKPAAYRGYWRLGAGSISGTAAPPVTQYGGELARVRIWDRPLDAKTAASEHALGPGGSGGWPATSPPPPDLARGLVLHLDPARASNGTGVADAGPLGNHARLDNAADAPSAVERNASLARPAAIVLDGVDDVVTTSRQRLEPDAFTLSVWFRTSRAGGKLIGFESQQAGRSGSYDRELILARDGSVVFRIYAQEGQLRSGPGLADGEWHHVLATMGSRGSDERMRLHVDGVLVAEGGTNEKTRYDGYWRLGAGSTAAAGAYGTAFAGRLAGARVYERPLTTEEAELLHAQGPDGLGVPKQLPPGAATLSDGLALDYDFTALGPDDTRVPDRSPLGNDGMLYDVVPNETSGPAPGEGLRFDGENDHVVTTRQFHDPDAFTLSVRFATNGSGKLIGFESQAAGRSGQYDRHLYVARDGRLHFYIYAMGGEMVSPVLVNDGAWHHAVAVVPSRGSGGEMRLYVDGEEVGRAPTPDKTPYPGYWRIGGGTLAGTLTPTPSAFRGTISSASVHDRALAPTEVAALHGGGAGPSDAVPDARDEPPGDAEADADADADATVRGETPGAVAPRGARIEARTDGLTVRVAAADLPAPERTTLYAVSQEGDVHEIGPATGEHAWDAPTGGLWTIEAREDRSDGGRVVVASTRALVLAPLATPAQAAGALAAGAGVATAASLASSRGFDLLGYLRRILFANAAERLKRRTKDLAAVRRLERLGSLATAGVAILVMALLVAAGAPGGLAPFVRALLVVGLAVVTYRGVVGLAQVALARAEGVDARYRFWTAGTLSVAVSSLVFHLPFGYTGFVQREPKGKPKPDAARRVGLAALGSLGAMAATSALFLGVGAFTTFSFAQVGMAMAIGAFAAMSIPVTPLPGRAVWEWSRPAAVAVALSGFAFYYAYTVGWMPAWGVATCAAVGAAAWAAALLANREPPRETPEPEAAPL